MLKSFILSGFLLMVFCTQSQTAKDYYGQAKKLIDSLDRLKKGADYSGAFNLLTSARDLDPKMKEPWFETGKILYRMGSYESALEYLNTAIGMDAKYGEAIAVRGLVYCQDPKTKKQGCSDLRKGIKLGYKHAEVWLKDNCN